MSGLFDLDGGLMGSLSKLTDMILLSILFVIFSIPVVTMGASFTAMYYTSVKSIRRGRSYIFKSFWKSFRENFFTATLFWVLMLLVGGILSLNFWYSRRIVGGNLGLVFLCLYGMMAIVALFIGIYIFPVLSRFELTKKKLLVNSFLMSIKHLPFTLLMIVIVAACFVAVFIIPPLLFILPAAGSLLYSLPMERILKKYTPASGDNSKDEWYLE